MQEQDPNDNNKLDSQTIWQQGYDSGLKGESNDHNPHEKYSEAYDHWLDGWVDGRTKLYLDGKIKPSDKREDYLKD